MSNIDVVRKNLGHVTAYKYAVSKGFQGTEEEFAELMASYASIAQDVSAESRVAEGYALGKQNGVDVGDQSPYYHANAKYHAEQAAASASAAAESARTLTIDSTLTQPGQAADAKVTGDKITGLKEDLNNYNVYDVLKASATYTDRTLYGVTFTWSNDKKSCTAVGTATKLTYTSLFSNTTDLPSGIEAGKTYRIKYRTTDGNLALAIGFYKDGVYVNQIGVNKDSQVTVPSDCTGMYIRLYVNNGRTVNGTASDIAILTAMTADETSKFVDGIKGVDNPNAKMRSFGNSILTGSVWQNGSAVGLAAYENAPYGRIARYLGVAEKNVEHTLKSSTGLIYDAGAGNFLSLIKDTDLTGFDYLLTMLYTPDLESTYGLGTENDTAEQTTLAGAVVDLVTYMRTNNGTCQLILVGPPPVSYTKYGATVFTANYANGFSISDVDKLMRRMAVMYHFIYIDWEQLNLSYYYQDYTDGDNVHANNETTYRIMGDYLASCIAYDIYDAGVAKNNEILKNYNSYDVLSDFSAHKSVTSNGVTFTWDGERKTCTAVGTATARAFTNLYISTSALPAGVVAGKTYYVRYSTTDIKFAMLIGLYLDNATSGTTEIAFNANGEIEIPENCTGMYIRLYVNGGNTVNAVASDIAILNGIPNQEIEARLKDRTLYSTDFLAVYGDMSDRTLNGISFDWTGGKCHVSGTATARANRNLYYGKLPKGMNVGDRFIVRYDSTSNSIGVEIAFYDKNGESLLTIRNSGIDIPFAVPSNAERWLFRIYVNNGVTIDAMLTRIQVVKIRPKQMDVPLIVSFIDDDTSSDALVAKFHDACCHNGVKGNYAVITKNLEDGNTSVQKLLEYEDNGFGTLIHCYQQSGASEWNDTPRTEAVTNACRANLAKGMRMMSDWGFVNYNYWITPGGHKEEDLREMSKQLGNKCLISTNNGRHNSMQDFNKWYIKRISLKSDDSGITDNSMAGVKALIDKTVADGGGWLIITTHFNDGWKSLTWDDSLDANGYPVGYSRFNEMVQYAINAGLTPMSIPQAWEYYEPILKANRDECNVANIVRN